MSDQTDNLLSLLTPYGVSDDEARVYLELWENGVSSALSLSRNLRIARTRVYRMLDKLEKAGLVVVRLHSRGKRFEASDPKKFIMLISEQQTKLERLRDDWSTIEEQLIKMKGKGRNQSKVLYYEGVEGVKQVSYNSLKAKGELLTMEIKDLDAFFSHREAEKLRLRFVEKKIKIRTLTNLKYIPAWTEKAQEMVERYWQIRHVAEGQMKIKFEILIYNNVYVMYRYVGKEVFCVEIYNQELADMQRQMFEYVWRKARRFKVLNKEGEARLLE